MADRKDTSPSLPPGMFVPAEIRAQERAGTISDRDRPAYGTPADPGGFGGRETHLWDFLQVILRRRWTAAAVFGFCALSALIFTLAATPLYRSTALLQIRPGGPNVVGFDEVEQSSQGAQAYSDFFQTQYDLLASRRLAKRTIEKVGLENDPWLNGDSMGESTVLRMVSSLKSIVSGEPDPELIAREKEQELLEKFGESIAVRPRRKSFLVELSFYNPDPETAAKVADAMAREYIDLTLDQRIEAAAQGRNFISKQLDVTKARLEETELELHAFAKGREIYAIDQEEEVIHERLADINNRLTNGESERIKLEALHNQMLGPDRWSLPIIVNDPLVGKLKEELATSRAERAQLGGRFTAEYPPVKVLDARIADIENTIQEQADTIVASVAADFRTALDREALLRFQLESQRKVIQIYEDKAIDFKIMRREVDTNRQIYEDLLRRMKEVEVTEAIRSSNITLVDIPEVPLNPDTPDLPLNMAMAMMLGLFGGVGLAFFQEYMDDSMSTPGDVERSLRLPVLGTVPEFAVADAEDGREATSPDMQVSLQPTSAGAEAIRTLRASLFLAAVGGLPTRLLITSARPSEGKTCIATNLAAALAQMGKRVVIIDCDLRKPRVHCALEVPQSPGVTNYIAGNMGIDQIIHGTHQPGLDVVAAGPVSPNPVDLLDSARMGAMLSELDDRYDHIIVDAPPTLGFADVPVLSNRLGGGCLLVTRAGMTPRRVAQQACDYMTRMQSKLLGVVLNRVSTRSDRFSYYGYYGYYGRPGAQDDGVTDVERAA